MNHGGAIQGMEVDCLVKSVYATSEAGKGRDVHLNVWTCLEFQSESQDGVCLTAFCVCDEKDFFHGRLSVLSEDPVEAPGIQARRALGIMSLPTIRDLR